MSIRNSAAIRAGGVAVVLAITACAMVVSPQAAAVEILDALEKCPDTEVACLQMDATLKWPGKREENMAKHPTVHETVVDENDRFLTHVFVRVTGRLNDGEVKHYHLKLTHDRSAQRCQDFLVAALGSRPEGGGVILTRQGTLEILSTEFEIGKRNHLMLLDLENRRQLKRLSSTWEPHPWRAVPFVHRDGHVFWRTSAKICLDLEGHNRFQAVVAENCDGEMSKASPEDIARVRDAGIFTDAYKIERLNYDLWRIEGALFLIYIWGVACT